ncbi:MAG: cytochrome C [Gammaproteobacteria bacterium (ex Lamellibrachia satsuma)]|nr:MAG: cytochrome C [Gammaproteobacteria bacterium (ex Lamellibrachia satsuma)]RRS36029.1 MAG: cytochrome C [Gammaproteobacteria bacterium (ex Lamellibrachia satsuma)]
MSIALAGAMILVSANQVMADDRDDVLSRIKPVGTVAIEGQPAPAAAPAATPAPAAAPAPAPVAAPAPAAGGSEGATLYAAKGCAGCHGADGKKTIMPVYPTLAGQTAAYLVAQMNDIKSGARNNGQSVVMKGIIAGVSDAEIESIADWLSNQ